MQIVAAADGMQADCVQSKINKPPDDQEKSQRICENAVVDAADHNAAQNFITHERKTDREDGQDQKNILSDVFQLGHGRILWHLK